jgi:hypothetical protein
MPYGASFEATNVAFDDLDEDANPCRYTTRIRS